MRILGIDPGSILCGWGVIDIHGNRMTHVASGTIRCGRGAFLPRLETIHREVADICVRFRPEVGAVEALYYQKNAQSALKLGHARGVAMVAMRLAGLDVTEFEPSVVKKSVVGKGNAGKEQVQQMVKLLLNHHAEMGLDESDALAIALCHGLQNAQLRRRSL